MLSDRTESGAGKHIARAVRVLRDPAWLTPARCRAYRNLFLAMTLAICAIWIAMSHHGIDPTGKPLGTDFVSFWIASRMALAGQAAEIYVPALHNAAERAAGLGGNGYVAFFYPPVFLLLCLPLGLLPYIVSLTAWLGVTGLAYWRGIRAIWPQAGLAILAFPAVFIDIGHGQNALLTAAILTAGLRLLDSRPVLAGLILGCLIYKPQFLPAIPLVLLAGARWRTLFGMALSGLGLIAASMALFGLQTWRAFLATTSLARDALEQGLMGFEKLQSVFGAIRLLGGGVGTAYAAQAVISLGVLACLIRLALRRPAGDALMAAASVGTLLITPFVLDYDLLALAPALAWAMRGATRTGFMPWEKSALATGFILPLVSRGLAGFASLPVGPLVLLAVFAVVLARAGGARDAAGAALP